MRAKGKMKKDWWKQRKEGLRKKANFSHRLGFSWQIKSEKFK